MRTALDPLGARRVASRRGGGGAQPPVCKRAKKCRITVCAVDEEMMASAVFSFEEEGTRSSVGCDPQAAGDLGFVVATSRVASGTALSPGVCFDHRHFARPESVRSGTFVVECRFYRNRQNLRFPLRRLQFLCCTIVGIVRVEEVVAIVTFFSISHSVYMLAL